MSARVRTACTDCGWTGNPRGYRSRAQADYAFRAHSCDKTRRARAAYERGLARDAQVDRTPKPCRHKVADHQHGTYAMYTLDGCRCLPCAAARARYDQDRARRRAYGQDAYVDARPATTHLRALMAAGMGWKRVAAAAGLDASVVYPLLYGRPDRNGGRPRTRARRATVDAILSVPMPTIDDLGATVTVDPTGTRRRLQALTALGWTVQRLADEHRLDRQALDAALHGEPIQAKTARVVRDMYDAVGDRRPEARTRGERRGITVALRRAAAHGWVVPAMWDDDQLDDVDATPPDGYGQARCTRPDCLRTDLAASGLCWTHYKGRSSSRPGVDLDDWAHLVRGGEDPARAAQRCGVTLGAVEVAIKRQGRDDLHRLLVRARGGEAA